MGYFDEPEGSTKGYSVMLGIVAVGFAVAGYFKQDIPSMSLEMTALIWSIACAVTSGFESVRESTLHRALDLFIHFWFGWVLLFATVSMILWIENLTIAQQSKTEGEFKDCLFSVLFDQDGYLWAVAAFFTGMHALYYERISKILWEKRTHYTSSPALLQNDIDISSA